ncbi:MAG: hypothetical protein ACPGYX_05330 [Oceanobacter sp.]
MNKPVRHQELKSTHREIRDSLPEFLDLRIHRALSWLNRAEQCEDDDGAFIFLWISLSAAYANDSEEFHRSDSDLFRFFFNRLIQLDKRRHLAHLLWDEFEGPVKKFLNNEYVYQRYWDFHNQKEGVEEWRISFTRSKSEAQAALANQKTSEVLNILLDRLSTLKNQLVLGGATWNSQVNRSQVHEGALILRSMVPVVITIMMEHPETHWGEPYYPVRNKG